MVQRDTSQEYQLFLRPVSERELRERVRRSMRSNAYNGCLAWYNFLNSTYHSSVEYSQLGICLNPIIFLRFFHVFNVGIGCLLTIVEDILVCAVLEHVAH